MEAELKKDLEISMGFRKQNLAGWKFYKRFVLENEIKFIEHLLYVK